MSRVLIGRRALVASGASIALLSRVAEAADLPRTAAQTRGPFYPVELPLDRDNNLVNVVGRAQPATGQVTHVFGRIVDVEGKPIAGARIEIWQCNAFGRYHHPGDRGPAPIDPDFQGFGQTVSAPDGTYRFRTIRPVQYPGRAPHIHFEVTAGGTVLTTQMYVEGEPGNLRDGPLNSIRDPRQRAALIVPLAPAPQVEAGALAGDFQIVMGRG
jgi:protocatechuate 3,4-dioxygenase beta subunit